MKRNQKGFTILEILLLVVIVGAVCGIAGYVISQNNKRDTQVITEPVNQPKNTESAQSSDPIDERMVIANTIADDCIQKKFESPDTTLKSKKQIIDDVMAAEIYRSDGKFTYVSTSCNDGPGGGIAYYLKKDPHWKVLLRTQDNPGCNYVDGATAEVIPRCYDESIQDLRPPKL